MADTPTTTYEIVQSNEGKGYGREQRLRITVPSDFKVTYGPLTPGVKGGSYGDGEGAVLRFYEDDKKQRAMFRKVLSFRDLSLPLVAEVVEVEEMGELTADSKGNAKAKSSRKKVTKFEVVG